MTYLDEAMKGIFLLILAVAGNFVAETLGCKSQKLLSNNMYAKHFVIILILYFAIDFTSGAPRTPFETLKLALTIYVLFILFTKMSIEFTILVFMMLATTYVIAGYISYYKETDPQNPNIEKLEQTRKVLYISMTGTILLGFSLYFLKQRRDYYKNWSTTKFLFGTNKCKSLQ